MNLNALGQPDCSNFKPYNPTDPNEFTGPMPRAVSGIFTISPEEMPYASQDATWQSTNITGVFIRPRWDDVHLGPSQFNWTQIDAEIDKAVRNGKVFSLGRRGRPPLPATWGCTALDTSAYKILVSTLNSMPYMAHEFR